MAVGPPDVFCCGFCDGVGAVSGQELLLALLADVLAGSEVIVGV